MRNSRAIQIESSFCSPDNSGVDRARLLDAIRFIPAFLVIPSPLVIPPPVARTPPRAAPAPRLLACRWCREPAGSNALPFRAACLLSLAAALVWAGRHILPL